MCSKKRKSPFKTILVILVLIAAGYFFFCSYATFIRTVRSVAQSEMEDVASRAIHNAIDDACTRFASYEELVNIHRDLEGRIVSLTLNAPVANRLKSEIAAKTLENLNDEENYQILVPLGNFFGSEFLSGMGPDIKFRIVPSNIASIDYESTFVQAGINQVLHRVSVKVDVHIGALLPGFDEISDLSSGAVISEAVIVGDVPDTYMNIEK